MQQDRVTAVDVVRGIALFGIFVVNVQYFASPYECLFVSDPNFTTVVDRVTDFVVAVLFEGKFYILFAFVFGYSFTLQMRSAERDGVSFQPRYLRRLFGLWCLGMLHAVFLFTGDILALYGVLGLVLLKARMWTDRKLLFVAASLLAGVSLVLLLAGLDSEAGQGLSQETLEQAKSLQQAYTGTPRTVIARNLQELPYSWSLLLFGQLPLSLSAFLLGLWAGRHRLLTQVDEHERGWKIVAWVGITIGLSGSLAYAGLTNFDRVWSGIAFGVLILTAPFLSAGYVALALLGLQRGRFGRVHQLLSSAGRMALSNYLLQSLVGAFVFYAYGFGLMGRVAPLACLALVVSFFVLQLLFSRWWMSRHVYGPVEWGLRAFTLWRWAPWARPGPDPANR